MVFKMISIGGISYGENYNNTDLFDFINVSNVDFKDPLFFNHLKDNQHPNSKNIK